MEREYNNKTHTIFLSKATSLFIKTVAILIFFILPAIGQSATVNNGGNGPIFDSISIFNENLTYVKPSIAVLSWETNVPATSRVIYDTKSQKEIVLGYDANNINHGYNFSTNQNNTLTKKHKVIIIGLTPNVKYFFRSESRTNNYARLGNEKTSNTSDIKTQTTTDCSYINSYLKIGAKNDTEEVLKLQSFLINFEGFTNVKMTGVFDKATFDAVSAFQKRYANEILSPWGITSPTGFVYYTTQKKINEIHCGKALSLTKSQINEINQFRTSSQITLKNNSYKNIGLKTDTSQNNTNNDNNSYLSDNKTSSQASLQASVVKTNTGPVRSIFNKFIGLFR